MNRTAIGRIGRFRQGVVGWLLVAAVAAGCSTTGGDPASTSSKPSSPTIATTMPSSPTAAEELDEVRAHDVALASCEMLRAWVNTTVAEINEASSAAADAEGPIGVRSAFLEAVSDIRQPLEAWPETVATTITGGEDSVVALRSDLTARSSEAIDVLDAVHDEIAAWPDDDTETRNARTQQAFIRLEGVMAEMKPDLGPYVGTVLGAAIEEEGACDLTFRP